MGNQPELIEMFRDRFSGGDRGIEELLLLQMLGTSQAGQTSIDPTTLLLLTMGGGPRRRDFKHLALVTLLLQQQQQAQAAACASTGVPPPPAAPNNTILMALAFGLFDRRESEVVAFPGAPPPPAGPFGPFRAARDKAVVVEEDIEEE